MSNVQELGERGVIERLARLVPTAPAVIEGIGDDCAVVRICERVMLLSCDLFIEDVHFRRAYASPYDIGWKSAVASMSDIAAMGGTPLFSLVSLALPPDTEVDFVDELYRGLSAALSRFGAVIVGGDTTTSLNGVALDVTVIGDAPGERYVRRTGAQAGDVLAVTGHLGLSAATLHALENGHEISTSISQRYFSPAPRIREGQWLGNCPSVHAMIDLSDGLISDANRLAEGALLGVDIESRAVPVLPGLTEYCEEQGFDPMACCLGGGEDYELAIVLDCDSSGHAIHSFHHEFRTTFTRVGRFTDEWQGVRIDGKEPSFSGYDHFKQ